MAIWDHQSTVITKTIFSKIWRQEAGL